MTPPNSAGIDEALTAALLADTQLMAFAVDGVYYGVAPPNARRFVIVSLVEETDEPVLGGRGFEDALYLVKAVARETGSAAVLAAAARIDVALEDQEIGVGSPASVTGYAWMTCHREQRIRYPEVDEVDPAIRWQHAGGNYRVQFSVT